MQEARIVESGVMPALREQALEIARATDRCWQWLRRGWSGGIQNLRNSRSKFIPIKRIYTAHSEWLSVWS